MHIREAELARGPLKSGASAITPTDWKRMTIAIPEPQSQALPADVRDELTNYELQNRVLIDAQGAI